jgi:ferrous iron transport protein B
MKSTTQPSTITVALVGNPNTGKSTLFNAISGVRQRVGNYPGVTVEKKIGHVQIDGQRFDLVDLPGTYSLAPRSPDEMVAVDVLLGRRSDVSSPDVIICIVDAGNLERNFYLLSQVLELDVPTIVALNMMDVADARSVEINVERLRERLGTIVVPMQANSGRGISELKAEIARAAQQDASPPESPFPAEFQQEVAAIQKQLADTKPLPRYLAERLLLDTSGYIEEEILPQLHETLHAELIAARERLASAGMPVPGVEAMARYEWVGKLLDGTVKRPTERQVTKSDKIDRVLTHPFGGTLIFAVMMLLVFSAVFYIAEPTSDFLEARAGWLSTQVGEALEEGALRSLIVSGVIAGVGGVLVFLPQIFVLFFFIAVLEDCGYMARAAYLMDRLMSRVGLSGKSFIPLLSSFACAIPGVMAARVIENRRDRLVTILVAPLMSCAARLPVYTLLTRALIPDEHYLGGVLGLRALTIFSMYLAGILAAVFVALILKKTVLKGETPPFVMELPSYKVPAVWTVLHRMFERGWAFIKRAGTVIFAVSIVVWAALYYPRDTETVEAPFRQRQTELQAKVDAIDASDPANADRLAAVQEELAEIDNEIAGEYQRQSYLGRAGQAIEPAVKPLGWDWRIGSAAIASFPAREVIVATLGVIYDLGGDVDEESEKLHEQLRSAKWDGTDQPVYNIPVALSIMVFFALCAQCAATLAVIRRETNSWRWPIFTFTYMTALAYVAALVTYQVGMAI